jgi:hypothetical protein
MRELIMAARLRPRPFWRSLLVAAGVVLLLTVSASALDVAEIERLLPRAYSGDFAWIGDKVTQRVRIRINLVRRLDDSHVEAIGCGRYEVQNRVTDIGIHMRIGTPGLDIEIKEFSPSGTGAPAFETSGSHKGRLTDDLQMIDAEWVTRATGQRGLLRLNAGGELICAGNQAGLVPRPRSHGG